MRILHFWDGFRKKAIRNQVGFIELLRNHCDLVLYGAKEKGSLNILKYDSKLTAEDIVNKLKPDCILLHFNERTRECLPKDFDKVKVPKIMLDVNHWKLVDSKNSYNNGYNWYKDIGIDLLIQRDYSFTKNIGIDALWLPFSASDEFFIDNSIKKENKITFVGSSGDKLYKTRRVARKTLNKHHLLADQGMITPVDYPKITRRFVGGLSCSLTDMKCMVNKTVEYMANGVAVLSSDFFGKESLFGIDECFYEYKYDCSDIVEKAKLLLNDKDLREDIVSRAYNIVHQKHMHEHRIKELYMIIEEFLSTGKKLDIWR